MLFSGRQPDMLGNMGVQPPIPGGSAVSPQDAAYKAYYGDSYDPQAANRAGFSSALHAIGQGLLNPKYPGGSPWLAAAQGVGNASDAFAQGKQQYEQQANDIYSKKNISSWINGLTPEEKAFAKAYPDKAAELYMYQNKPMPSRYAPLPASSIQEYNLSKTQGDKRNYNQWFSDHYGDKASATATGKAQGTASVELGPALVDANRTVQKIDELLADPALASATGWQGYVPDAILPMTPGGGQGALNARTKINQLHGRAFMDAYATLKGGGQITEIEGEKATDALARLNDPRINDADYKTALVDFRDAVQSGINKLAARAGQPAPTVNPPMIDTPGNSQAPDGIDQNVWDAMTPDEKATFQ